MNLLLFDGDELTVDSVLPLSGTRAQHLLEVLRVKPGAKVKVGQVYGGIGAAEVLEINPEQVVLKVGDLCAPAAIPQRDLLLALPRPQSLKKVFQIASAMGVRGIYLMNSSRVEQSYFSSVVLRKEEMREHLLLGLAQGQSTYLPEVKIFPKLTPRKLMTERDTAAVKEILNPEVSQLLMAEPAAAHSIGQLWLNSGQKLLQQRILFAVGPEGGWIPAEEECFAELGFKGFSLGERTLRVENAVCAVLAQFDLLQSLTKELER